MNVYVTSSWERFLVAQILSKFIFARSFATMQHIFILSLDIFQ
jgi:hypothetical protein